MNWEWNESVPFQGTFPGPCCVTSSGRQVRLREGLWETPLLWLFSAGVEQVGNWVALTHTLTPVSVGSLTLLLAGLLMKRVALVPRSPVSTSVPAMAGPSCCPWRELSHTSWREPLVFCPTNGDFYKGSSLCPDAHSALYAFEGTTE